MSNGFEFYEGATSENTAPKITVRKGGQLVLTRGAIEMLGEDVEYVQLAFNSKTKVVGLCSATEDAKGRYRLRPQGSNGLHLVTGKRFFAHYGLSTDKARTFNAETFDGGIVGFQLPEGKAETAPKPKAGGKAKTGRRSARAAS